MAMFEQAMSMWASFGALPAEPVSPGSQAKASRDPPTAAERNATRRATRDELSELKGAAFRDAAEDREAVASDRA